MPACLRCGRTLAQVELRTQNWARISERKCFSCGQCGAHWLYSKSLNCPILLDPRSIMSDSEQSGGKPPGKR